MEMMLEVGMGVMGTEDDKVADMVLKIPDVTVAIGDTYGDDVKGNGVGGGHKWHHLVVKFRTDKSGAIWWTNFQLMEVVPSGW